MPIKKRKSQGTVVSIAKKQRGSTNKPVDKGLPAIEPGKRKTKNPHYHQGKLIRKSTTYIETRKNRSDKKAEYNHVR